jgi:REP-associated tyrosine transposase
MEYAYDEHRTHLIVYHLIWCPKRRKKVLQGAVAADCERLIREVCAGRDWQVLQLAIQPDHVHLFVRVRPTDSAADVVNAVKGRTSHDLRSAYPVLLKLPSLWTGSYFASTAGNVSAPTIETYIAAQKGR